MREEALEKRGLVSPETSQPSGSPSGWSASISVVFTLLTAGARRVALLTVTSSLRKIEYAGVPTLSSYSSVAVKSSLSSASLKERAVYSSLPDERPTFRPAGKS